MFIIRFAWLRSIALYKEFRWIDLDEIRNLRWCFRDGFSILSFYRPLPNLIVNNQVKRLILNGANFVLHIWKYNSAIAFILLAVMQEDIPSKRPRCFKTKVHIHWCIMAPLTGRDVLPSKLVDGKCWIRDHCNRLPKLSEFSMFFFKSWISLHTYDLAFLKNTPRRAPPL